MEPVSALAVTIVSLIGPFVAKGAEKFAQEAGAHAYETVKGIWDRLRSRWSGDEEAGAVLEQFERRPERYGRVLTDVLEEQLAGDRELASQLNVMIGRLGPALEVVQEMEEARRVTGLEADELTEGRVTVRQRIGSGEDVTGARIRRIGPSAPGG